MVIFIYIIVVYLGWEGWGIVGWKSMAIMEICIIFNKMAMFTYVIIDWLMSITNQYSTMSTLAGHCSTMCGLQHKQTADILKGSPSWGHDDMGTLLALLVPCEGYPLATMESPHKGPLMVSFDALLTANLNKQLNSSQWFQMPWCSCDITVMLANSIMYIENFQILHVVKINHVEYNIISSTLNTSPV